MGVFGWSLPPGCGTLPGEEEEQENNTLVEQAFKDYYGLFELYRTYYKYTACGPTIGAQIKTWVESVGEEPVYEMQADGDYVQKGTQKFSTSKENVQWHYCDRLYQLGTWEEMRKAGQLILALRVSSIVEGIDVTTDTHVVNVADYDSPEALYAAFNTAVEEVNDEAEALWQETHGCDTCVKHWRKEGVQCEVGAAPVWADCPDCAGSGMVI